MSRMNMKHKQQYRQGDVLFEYVDAVPSDAKKQPASRQIVVALGEATGHHHAVETEDPADWWKHADETFVKVTKPAKVTHQEHAPFTLKRGIVRVSRQREYTPEAIRRVAD